jgi:hypothetical protein
MTVPDDPKLDAKQDQIDQKAEEAFEDKLKKELGPSIWEEYHQLGGKPLFGQQLTDLTVHGPQTVTVAFQHGMIAAVKNKGAYGVVTGFYEKWKHAIPKLGLPSTDIAASASERHQRFYGNGLLVQKLGAPSPLEVQGPILDKYKQLGGAAGWLGCPITDETKTPDGKGVYNHFEHRGSIYFKPTTGAHEVHGLIRDLWASRGWEKDSQLGWPISDETPTQPGSANRYTNFENGVIYWQSGDLEAVALKAVTRSPAQMRESLATGIADAIKNMPVPDAIADDVDGFQVTSGPAPRNYGLFGSDPPSGPFVTDYKVSSSGHTINRRFMFNAGFDIIVSGSADISVDLDLDLEIFWAHASKTAMSRIIGWQIKPHVPWPTNWSVGAGTVAKEVDKALQSAAKPKPLPLDKKSLDALTLINVLTMKTMPNGSLATFFGA